MGDDSFDSQPPQRPSVRSPSSFDLEGGPNHVWTARVCATGDGTPTVYTGNHSFMVARQASFGESDKNPSATDYLLGALGADLICGFSAVASRRGIFADALEARVSGYLNNPLVLLGVVGETGHPGFQTINVAFYVNVDANERILEEIWEETLMRSPLVNTLKHAVELVLELKTAI